MSAQKYCECEPMAQQTCKLCGESFAIVRKAGRPREYCWSCEPVGWRVVKLPHQSRVKLRRRPSRLPRLAVVARKAA